MTKYLSFLALPEELLLHIFKFVFHSWFLQVRLRDDPLTEIYYNEAVVQALPSQSASSLLLVCKRIRRIATRVMLELFSGTITYLENPAMARTPPEWRHLDTRVKKICLPGTRYILSQSESLILSLPCLETVELFEDNNLMISLGEHIGVSEEDLLVVLNAYVDVNANVLLPCIPQTLPFKCNRGHLKLLLNLHFNINRGSSASTLDVTLEIGLDKSLTVLENGNTTKQLYDEDRT